MDVVHSHCAALDVHLKTIAACRVVPGAHGKATKEIRTFGTMTDDLLRLADWRTAEGITHVAMESTGVYWKPVYNVLEGSFELLLVNAQHIKNVAGRKSDVKDCEWLADLLRHGLVKASFVPDRDLRELREWTRYRTTRVRERVAEVNRVQKTLEGANIKLAIVASNVLGVSARQMLEALVDGETDAAVLAQLAKTRMRAKIPLLERALSGRFGKHQQFLVARQLAHIDDLDGLIEEISAEVVQRCATLSVEVVVETGAARRPFEEAVKFLDTIPGVGLRIAETIVAEIGIAMDRFPSAKHLASWAGLVPGLRVSGGKRLSNKTHKGARWLRTALVEAAQAAARKKGTYLSAQYHRLAGRRGKKKALVAVAHTILGIAYYLIKHGVAYEELGAGYFDERDRDMVERRLVQRLEQMGNKVTIERQLAA
jgi:transposase